jgi:hypothetical protein
LNRFREQDAGKHWGCPYCWTECQMIEPPGLGRGTVWAWASFLSDGEIADDQCRADYAHPLSCPCKPILLLLASHFMIGNLNQSYRLNAMERRFPRKWMDLLLSPFTALGIEILPQATRLCVCRWIASVMSQASQWIFLHTTRQMRIGKTDFGLWMPPLMAVGGSSSPAMAQEAVETSSSDSGQICPHPSLLLRRR